MKIHLIKKQTIEDYLIKYARSRPSFEVWLSVIKMADWNEPNDIISTFNSADILGNGTNRVVFNIGGNNYLMIAKYHFGINRIHLFIKWIGTHSEYTKLCDRGLQYEVDKY
jgi:mRNA interferase HigB